MANIIQRKMKTNYNNKLSCRRFIHIDLAPKQQIPESVMNTTVIEISTLDNSHPPVQVKVYDLARVKLKDISASFVSLSHGLELDDYLDIVLKEMPNISSETEMGIYFYKKV